MVPEFEVAHASKLAICKVHQERLLHMRLMQLRDLMLWGPSN